MGTEPGGNNVVVVKDNGRIERPGKRAAEEEPVHETELVLQDTGPTAEWLESDKEARRFLTTVGFPAVRIECVDCDSSDLPKKGPWEADPDELFGLRYPDDDTPPTSYCYTFGTYSEFHLVMHVVIGNVDVNVYDPNGWDHAAGHGGWAVSSLPQLAGALRLPKFYEEQLNGADLGDGRAASGR